MRTAELQKQIDTIPELRLVQAKLMKRNDHIVKTRNGKIHSEHIVKDGVERYWIYDLNDNLIKTGVAK